MTAGALYPGCSLVGTARAYRSSLAAALAALGIELPELDGWNCCGATSAHALDHGLYLRLALRNLALAEKQGFGEVLAPCAACYHRLASANLEAARDAALLAEVNRGLDHPYGGAVAVRNVLDFLANVVGTERIAARVARPLPRTRVACYYGCLNTRVPRLRPFDDPARPTSMDRIVRAIGGVPVEWGYATDCCGASLFVTAEAASLRLVGRILADAAARGADCIAVACPMCHNNLDTKQARVRRAAGVGRALPVLFFTQLAGAAFGCGAAALRLGDGFVSPAGLELAKR